MRRELSTVRCKLMLCEVHPDIKGVLERLNLLTLFEIRNGERDALMAV